VNQQLPLAKNGKIIPMTDEAGDRPPPSDSPFFSFIPQSTITCHIANSDIQQGLSVMPHDLEIYRSGDVFSCCSDMFCPCIGQDLDSKCTPEQIQAPGEACQLFAKQKALLSREACIRGAWQGIKETLEFYRHKSFLVLSDSIHKESTRVAKELPALNRPMVASAVALKWRTEQKFHSGVRLLTQFCLPRSDFPVEKVIKRLAANCNFLIVVDGIEIQCNRLIAASECREIANAFRRQPDIQSCSVSIESADEAVVQLKKLLVGELATISCDVNFEGLTRALGIRAFERCLKEREIELARREAVMRQLEQVITFQEETDYLTPETLSAVTNCISGEFASDPLLCKAILQHAFRVNPHVSYDAFLILNCPGSTISSPATTSTNFGINGNSTKQ
jgi:hypothetical protein